LRCSPSGWAIDIRWWIPTPGPQQLHINAKVHHRTSHDLLKVLGRDCARARKNHQQSVRAGHPERSEIAPTPWLRLASTIADRWR
jgi:hypothetical protein